MIKMTVDEYLNMAARARRRAMHYSGYARIVNLRAAYWCIEQARRARLTAA